NRKRLQGACENWQGQLDMRHMSDQGSRLLAMRSVQPASVNSIPEFVFEETARDQLPSPQKLGRGAILRQELGQRDRGVQMDHRSSRSCRSSSINVRKAAIGL